MKGGSVAVDQVPRAGTTWRRRVKGSSRTGGRAVPPGGPASAAELANRCRAQKRPAAGDVLLLSVVWLPQEDGCPTTRDRHGPSGWPGAGRRHRAHAMAVCAPGGGARRNQRWIVVDGMSPTNRARLLVGLQSGWAFSLGQGPAHLLGGLRPPASGWRRPKRGKPVGACTIAPCRAKSNGPGAQGRVSVATELHALCLQGPSPG